MACTKPHIKKYLHYTADMRKYANKNFKKWHLVYRTGFKEDSNPIKFPSVLTSYSLNWSKLIKPNHVLETVLAENPSLGDSVFFGKIKLIKLIDINSECPSGVYLGMHRIQTVMQHEPVPCNYSHCEILIKHTYLENNESKEVLLRYDDWKDCQLNVGKPPKFFKELRGNYRAKVATILNNRLQDRLPWYFRIFNSRKLVSAFLYVRLRFGMV
jgi:hypothetical protein